MLQADLNKGRYEIVQQVAVTCALFGEVRNINVFLEAEPTAVVRMSTAQETVDIAAQLKGRLVGSVAFIPLVHQPNQLLSL